MRSRALAPREKTRIALPDTGRWPTQFAGHLDRMRMCGDCRVIDMMTPTDEQTIHQAQELRRR